MLRSPLLLALMIALVCTAPAQAQHFCFRPGPASRCSWFSITEVGAASAIAGSRTDMRLIWTLGLGRRVGRNYAVGATVSPMFDDGPGVELSTNLRARAFLPYGLTVDIAPGVVLRDMASKNLPPQYPTPDQMVYTYTRPDLPGFALDLAFGFRDWAGVFVRTEVLPYSQVDRFLYVRTVLPGIGTTWSSSGRDRINQRGALRSYEIGVRAGSYPGLILGALGVAFAAWFHSANQS